MLAQASAAAAKHANTHGRPISRDALRQALRVSNRTAGALLHQLRANPADPDQQPQDQDGGLPVPAEQPGAADPSQDSERSVAGNGASGRPADLAALVPIPGRGPVPGSAKDGQGVARDA